MDEDEIVARQRLAVTQEFERFVEQVEAFVLELRKTQAKIETERVAGRDAQAIVAHFELLRTRVAPLKEEARTHLLALNRTLSQFAQRRAEQQLEALMARLGAL